MVPVAGSAYTYSYAVMGEIIAWLVGWALILEYAVGASAVAVGWSGFITGPSGIRRGTLTACLEGRAADPVGLPPGRRSRRIFNLPAVVGRGFVTTLLVIGTKESATFNAVLVVIKITALTLFLIITLPMISGHAPTSSRSRRAAGAIR